jgi:simple sugar transport system ATP-binding protein
MATPDLVRMERISKAYGRVQALRDVTFTVREREIVGLLGDNGAGKSTLIKILSGAVPPTSGEIYIRGKRVDIRSTTDAIRNGIETIYQDSALVTQLSIARNLFLGREPVKGPRWLNRMDKATMNRVAGELLRRVGITKNIPPTTPIASLSGGERQSVAIARAVYFGARCLILDEPTSALGVKQSGVVLRYVAQARDRGLGVIFITHNPHHAYPVGDRFVILNRGRLMGDWRKSEISRDELVKQMSGGAELEALEHELQRVLA